MTNTKHTPGPWRYQLGRVVGGFTHLGIHGAMQTDVASLREGCPNADADGPLIAAAPLMYAALERIASLPNLDPISKAREIARTVLSVIEVES